MIYMQSLHRMNELNINKGVVLSTTLKCKSNFNDYDIIGTTHRWITTHDYLGVAMSSDLTWPNRVTKFLARLAEPLVYLKEPYPLLSKWKIYYVQDAFSSQLEYASEVWNPHTIKCIKKIEQIHRNSFSGLP